MKNPLQHLPESFKHGLWQGGGIVIGMFATSLFAVAVSGTVTWTSGQTLTAADLNSTINGLVTAVTNIPDWTKNGSNAYYTTGNVGIGITTPSDKLDISMNGGNNQDGVTIRAANSGGGPGTQPGIRFNRADGTKIFSIAGDEFNDALFINSRTSGGGSPDISVNQLGNVGIGLSNPSAKLHISNGAIRVAPATGGANWLEMVHNADSNISWSLNDGFANRDFQIYRYNSSGVHLDAPFTISNSSGAVTITGALSKGSGTFDIPHPDPSMPKDSRLRHSFVESPTAGDNIYRWQVKITSNNGKSYINLPKYWKHLNSNPMVWVSSANEPAQAFGYVDSNEEKLIVQANKAGTYNVLLLGTRKDEVAVSNWKSMGMEYIAKGIGEAERILSYEYSQEKGSIPNATVEKLTRIESKTRKSEL